MPRVTIHMPNDTHEKIIEYAEKNDDSISGAVTKMAEIGLLVTESRKKQKEEDKYTDIEKYCQKLIIQINALVKNLASKQAGYDEDDFTKLRDATLKRYNEIAGIEPEEL